MLRRENQGDLFDDQVVLPSLESVLTGISSSQRCDDRTTYFSAPDVDLSLYDHIIVCLSGKELDCCVLAAGGHGC